MNLIVQNKKMLEKEENKHYILYDGECPFCNHWVEWLLKNDKKDEFLFAPLQSNFAQSFLYDRNLDRTDFKTLYLYKPNQYYYTQSDAVLKIAEKLGGKYLIISYLKYIPKFIRNGIYSQIANNRQKLSSQKCFVPTEEEKRKFIE